MDDLDLEIHGRSGRSMHRKRTFTGCKDRMCGADDCPTCRPDTYDIGHPIGHGATEEEAIADLKSQLDEE